MMFEFDPAKSESNRDKHGIDFIASPAVAKRSASSRSAGPARPKKPSTATPEPISASRLDELHDSGADISSYLDMSTARRPGREVQRVNVDFPLDLLDAIDREAARIGVSRQAFIKLRLADVLPRR